jgi:uncharacterized integral membrane protein
MRLILKIISKAIFILVLAVIVVFCMSNNQTAQISFSPLPFKVETRLFIVILLAIFGGMFIGFACSSIALTKERFKNFLGRLKIKFLQRKVDKIADKINLKAEK